ncbi:MAG: type II secretion system protein [Candidatus Colwellbacteria bacterium]|nr:type II secretion system protein [Candidatus Colwellbacteria bacterium]
MSFRSRKIKISEVKRGSSSGFTLIELLIYAVIFSISSGLLTGILVTISNVQTKENASFEVTRQLQFVTQRMQYAIRDASIIQDVYEGDNPGTACTSFCTVRLRVEDDALDPTVISSDANGVYVKEGANPKVALTSPNVHITSLLFNHVGNPGGLSTLTVNLALVYVAPDSELQIARTISSAIAHVSAATFDTDLLPDATDSRSIGGTALKWKDITVSNGITVAGPVGVGEFSGLTMSKGTTHGTSSINEYYVTSTPYDKFGQRFDVGGTPLLYLEGDISQTGRRAYFLSGNVGIGTSAPQGLLHVHTNTVDAPATLYLTNGGQTTPPSDLGAIWFGSTEGVGYTASGIKGLAEADFNTTDWPSALTFWTTADNSGVPAEAMRITRDRNVGIGTTTPGSYRLYVNGGDAYFSGDVSALSFTDRTPYPENLGIAYDAVLGMKRLPDGEYQPGNKEQQLDHSTLTDFVKGKNGDRDLSATVSAQNEVIKDLISRIDRLEENQCVK